MFWCKHLTSEHTPLPTWIAAGCALCRERAWHATVRSRSPISAIGKKTERSALVVLAGLYAQGDGVAKDCDQAKILLDAAARQAKSHTQFQHVETARASLRTSGCGVVSMPGYSSTRVTKIH